MQVRCAENYEWFFGARTHVLFAARQQAQEIIAIAALRQRSRNGLELLSRYKSHVIRDLFRAADLLPLAFLDGFDEI